MITNSTNTCPYATMCGWCSKWDKMCNQKIGADMATRIKTNQFDENNIGKITAIETRMTDSNSATSSEPKRCDNCDKTNKIHYDHESHYVGLQCTVTGKERSYDDVCDCEGKPGLTATATN